MIMMLLRTALWGVAIIASAFAFVWLKDAVGAVSIELEGRTYGPFSPLEFVALIVAIAFFLWLAFKAFGLAVALVRFASGDETALSRFWNRSRERRGFDAYSQGVAALAEGDGRSALLKARKAERLLDRPGLTRVLVARAAEASGERTLARDYYKQLASDPMTAYLGVKGLLDQALARGDKARALKLAAHAFELKAKDPDLLVNLFDLQCEAGDWEGARRTLHGQVKTGALTRDIADRREAVLLIADAKRAEDGGDKARAKELAARAHKKSPALTTATVAVATQQKADGSARRAAKTLREAWRAEPHPDLAAAYAALEPDESVSARRRRFGELTRANQDHAESKMVTAELAIADKDWTEARRAMGDLAEVSPSSRTLSLMAAIARGEGAPDGDVRALLSQAIAAPRGAQWTCDNCGARHSEWTPRCDRCDAFDALVWREGDASEAEAAAAPQMLDDEAAPTIDAAAPNSVANGSAEPNGAPEPARP